MAHHWPFDPSEANPHHCLGVLLASASEARLHHAGKVVSLVPKAGAVLFLPAGCTVAPASTQHLLPPAIWFQLEAELRLSRVLSKLPPDCWCPHDGLAAYLPAEARDSNDLNCGLRAQAGLLLVVSELLERHPQARVDESRPAKLRAAIEYMDQHFMVGPRLDEIAAREQLSPAHFHRMFKAAFGLTPREYMLRRRIGLGHTLVTTTDRKLLDIAVECGFSCPFYFSRVYKSVFGESPQHVRQRRRDR